MTTAIYLEHYLESLESLPVELQRNFNLMRNLDGRAQNLLQDIDQMGDDFLKNSKEYPNQKKKEVSAKIQKLFNKAKEYADDKVQLAIQTYELVDKHIRRLDSDLARFENDIKNGPGQSVFSPRSEIAVPVVKSKNRKREKEPTKKSKAKDTEDKSNKIGSASPAARKKHKSEIASQLASEQTTSAVPGDMLLDMQIDPNEPTYCVCNQVSYGNMVACDNPDCPIEWYHYPCVGITQPPKGKWFCSKCQPLKKK